MTLNDIINKILTSSKSTQQQKDGFAAYRFCNNNNIESDDITKILSKENVYILIYINRRLEFMLSSADTFEEAYSILKDKWCLDYTDNLSDESYGVFTVIHNGHIIGNDEIERLYKGIK